MDNFTSFIVDRKEYSNDNKMVLVLIPKLLDSNLEKLELYYNSILNNNFENSSFDDSLISFNKTSYNGVETEIVVYNNKNCTFDNTLECSLQIKKKIDRIRIEIMTSLSDKRDTIMAYNLQSRLFDVVTDFVVNDIKINLFTKKKNSI